MTITDEELYRLAHNAHCYSKHGFGLSCTSLNEIDQLRSLRDAVLQRFKPREPRVMEKYFRIYQHGAVMEQGDNRESIEEVVRIRGGYLAKAVITEVMEDTE